MNCPQCGVESSPGAAVCAGCGAALAAAADAVTLGGPDAVTLEGAPAVEHEVLFDRYEVIEELGEGGMGRVLRVRDRKVGEEVALKLIAPRLAASGEMLERFRNEVKLARKIAHRNVCRVFDLGEVDGTFFLTMEYVRGEELNSVLARSGKLPTATLISIAEGLCKGLAEAHRMGVVHRDLKPGNIMIGDDGEPHILDFGIARSGATAGLTMAGFMIGTPKYMSPEQASGGEIDARSDIYSLGAIFFEMAVGQPPFEGDSPVAVAVRHKTEPAPDPRAMGAEVPEHVSWVIRKCLEKSPADRFQDVGEILTVLRGGLELTSASALARTAQQASFLDQTPEQVSEETAFAAREEEMAALDESLQAVLGSQGRVRLISGEPGSGKSTLATEFALRALRDQDAVVVAMGRCDPITGAGDAYHPFRQILELLTGDVEGYWKAGTLTRDQAGQLWALAPRAIAALVEHGPELIETLISAERLLGRAEACASGSPPWLVRLKDHVARIASAPPASLREDQIVDRYSRVLLSLAHHRRLVLILDDLHWVDTGSVGLLLHLARRMAGSPILLLGTYRSADLPLGRNGDRHPLEPALNELKRQFGEIEIALDRTEGRRFLEAYLDTQPNRFEAAFRDALFEQTRGHALFTVELLRSMRDRGMIVQDDEGAWTEGPELDWERLPQRTEGVIAERVERVPEALRELLNLASIEGQEFTAEVIAGIQQVEARSVIRLLSTELDRKHRLVRSQGIRRVDGRRLSRYRFRHGLFQKYLYGQMDEVERSVLHEDVATTLESLYGEQSPEAAVQLSEHYELAANSEKAIHYRTLAGEAGLRLSAFKEATGHLQRGLRLVAELPAAELRLPRELQLRSLLASGLTATEGYGSSALEENYQRMHELSDELGDSNLKGIVLYLLWGLNFIRGNLEETGRLAERHRQLAEATDDPTQGAVADLMLGVTRFFEGRLEPAAEPLARAAAAFDVEGHATRMMLYGSDPLFAARLYAGWNHALRGEIEEALSAVEATLEVADEMQAPFAQAEALSLACTVLWDAERDVDRVAAAALRCLELCQEHGFPFYLASALSWKGVIAVYREGAAEGAGEIQAGLQMKDQLFGALVPGSGSHHFQLADAYRQLGEVEDGLAALDRGEEVASQNQERYYAAEGRRLRGELLRQRGAAAAEVEGCLREAIEIAAGQGARMLELRAAVSLAELLREGDREAEARQLLTPLLERYPGAGRGADAAAAERLLA